MKKTITILLVIVILFNYIFSTCVFAEESEESPADTTSKYSMDKSQIDSMIEDGKTTDINGNKTGINYGRPNMGWRYDRNTMNKLIEEDRIIWPDSPDGRPRKKSFLSEILY